LNGGLGGWNDVDQLDGVFAGGLEPECEWLDAAGRLLCDLLVYHFLMFKYTERLTALMKMMYSTVKK